MLILLADDHAVLREGLKQILGEEFPGVEFREATTTADTLEALAHGGVDVLLLDLFMPGRGGLDVLAEARRTAPDVPILVVSSAPEEQLGFRTIRAGASGYVDKQRAAESQGEAIRKVLEGGRYVSPRLEVELAETSARKPGPLHENLSDREFEVMRLIIEGKSLKEIAFDLALSTKTISTFHTRIWQKLGVRNDVELMRYAFENGLSNGLGRGSGIKCV